MRDTDVCLLGAYTDAIGMGPQPKRMAFWFRRRSYP